MTHNVRKTEVMFYNFYNRTQYIYPASVMRSKTNRGLVFGVVLSVLTASSMFMLSSKFTSLLCFLFRSTLQFQYPYTFTPCDQYLVLSSSTSTLKLYEYLQSSQPSSLMITIKDLLLQCREYKSLLRNERETQFLLLEIFLFISSYTFTCNNG